MRTCWAGLLVCCLGLAGGCASTHTATVKNRDKPYLEKGRIQWNSSRIKAVLRIDTGSVEHTDAGLLRLRLTLRNKTKKDVVVDIRTTFLDEDGFEVEKTNWEPIVCTARTQTQYETVSLSPKVHEYQVIIRDPKSFKWAP